MRPYPARSPKAWRRWSPPCRRKGCRIPLPPRPARSRNEASRRYRRRPKKAARGPRRPEGPRGMGARRMKSSFVPSDIEEHGFAFTLKTDIEAIGVFAFLIRDQGRDAGLVFDAGRNRVSGVCRFLFRKIHPCVKTDVDATRNDPESDVRGH